jgi:hypothetical protein
MRYDQKRLRAILIFTKKKSKKIFVYHIQGNNMSDHIPTLTK